MTSLSLPSVQFRSAGVRFVAAVAATAAMVAVALTLFGPTPPHAGAQAQTTFETNLSVRVPFVDPHDVGDNDLGGITIAVTYTPVSSPMQEQGCTPSATEMFTIHESAGASFTGGLVEPPATRETLVNTPMNSQTPCRYVANFADSFTHSGQRFNILMGDNAEFEASDFDDDGFLQVAYGQDDVFFFPVVDVRVLQINDATDDPATDDRDETELNYFRNTTIAATIAPTSDSPTGCSSTVSGRAAFRVQESGQVWHGTAARGERGLMLIDVPSGAADGEFCEYTVTFPTTEGSPGNARESFTLTLLGTETANIDRDNPSVVREYRRPEATRFTATIEIRDFDGDLQDGVQWDVNLLPASNSHAGCSTARIIRLRTGAYGSPSGVATLPVTLVRRPVGANADGSEDCDYDAWWPESEVGGMAYRRHESEISGRPRPNTVAHYADFVQATFELAPPEAQLFTPSISITVPQLDGVTVDENFLTAHQFLVLLQRDTTSATIRECSLETNLRVTMSVDSDGTVAASPQLPATLNRSTAGGEACGYTVEFPASTSPVGTVNLGYTLTRGTATATLDGDNTSVSSDYTVGEITFTPGWSLIDVPVSGHNGKQIRATFTGSRAACPSRTLMYTVNSGTVVPDGSNTPLVAYPAGATATSDRCTYTVAFDENEVGGTTLELQSGSTMSMSHQSRRLMASYEAAPPPPQMETTFMPSITVTVPQLEGTTQGENLFAGTEFTVEVQRAGGAHGDCSLHPFDPVELTYMVETNGSVTTTDPDLPATLTGTVSDGMTCAYTLSPVPANSATDAELMWLLEASQSSLSGTSTSVTLAYLATSGSTAVPVTFDPDATITVPPGSAGKEFEVQFTSSQASCSGNPTAETLTWVVQSDGVTVAPDTNNASLVAYPATATMSSDVCSYAVEFSMNETGGTTLVRQAAPAPTATVTGVAQGISASYAAPSTGGTQPPAPPAVTTPSGSNTRRPSTGGGGGGRTSGGSSGGGSSGGSGAASGPFVPSATARVPIAVSLALPVDTFSAPTPVELLVHAPGECGTDVATFDGLAAMVGVVYALDAATGDTAGATAEIIVDGARQLAQFAERGTQQRPCELRVTLLSAPAGCALRATSPATDQPAVDQPAASVRTDADGRSYVELAWSDSVTSLTLTPTLTCS